MKLKNAFRTYVLRLKSFQWNARMYLVYVLTTGATMGVFRLIFNFYILSLGFDEALIGKLISVTQLTGVLLAIPMGFLVDRVGKKPILLSRSILLTLAIGIMAIFHNVAVFYAMNVLLGVVYSISAVVMAPFLMENSGEEERTYLFSFGSGLRMGSEFIGSWVGGYLPSWIGALRGISATSSGAYGGALLATTFIAVMGFVPLFFVRSKQINRQEDQKFSPLQFAIEEPKLIVKLLLPTVLISIGASLFMPFMNVFFRVVHHQSDQTIGMMFAWGSFAMGVGFIIAPTLADRFGKIQLVTITQGLSIPFMLVLGFSPIFSFSAVAYYIRIILMNMSEPIYQTFVMESVDEKARVTVASLASMTSRLGRAFSPTISGILQVNYGFGIPFAMATMLYALSVFFNWAFFLRGSKKATKPKLMYS